MFLRSIQHEYTSIPATKQHLALFMLYPGQAGSTRRVRSSFTNRRVTAFPVCRESCPSLGLPTWPLWGRKETGVVIEGQEQHKKSDAISAVVNTIDLDYFSRWTSLL